MSSPSPDKWDALRRAAEAAHFMLSNQGMYDAQKWSSEVWNTFTLAANPAAILELLSELRGTRQLCTMPLSDGNDGSTCIKCGRLMHDPEGMERGGEVLEFNRGVEAAAVAVEETWEGWDGVVARIRREKLPVAATLSVTEGQTDQPRQDEAQNLRYVKQIAEYIREKYFPDVPQWKPLTGDLFGLLMQIDNMLTGLVLARSVTEGVDGWIDCKQELPHPDTNVLCCDFQGSVHMAWYRPDGGQYTFDCDTYGLSPTEVTHWRRLPLAPPKAPSSLDATKGDRG